MITVCSCSKQYTCWPPPSFQNRIRYCTASKMQRCRAVGHFPPLELFVDCCLVHAKVRSVRSKARFHTVGVQGSLMKSHWSTSLLDCALSANMGFRKESFQPRRRCAKLSSYPYYLSSHNFEMRLSSFLSHSICLIFVDFGTSPSTDPSNLRFQCWRLF